MKLSDKINVKKALIVFPIVIVLIGGTLIGAFSVLFDNEGESASESAIVGENVEDVIQDEKALKILDIHENLANYVDKEISLEGYFMVLDETTKVFGVELPLGDGSLGMASLSYELTNPEILDNITDTSLVKASGKIESFEELHEDDEKGDHNHTLPKFKVEAVEIIR